MYPHHTRSPTVEGESEHQHACGRAVPEAVPASNTRECITRYHLALRLHRSGERRLKSTDSCRVGRQRRSSEVDPPLADPRKSRVGGSTRSSACGFGRAAASGRASAPHGTRAPERLCPRTRRNDAGVHGVPALERQCPRARKWRWTTAMTAPTACALEGGSSCKRS